MSDHWRPNGIIVYLDQNKWVDLSRAALGLIDAQDVYKVYESLQSLSDQGFVHFPLSLAHYTETHWPQNENRRRRLASVMWNLSRGFAMAPLSIIVPYEIDQALARFFPGRVPPRDFQIFGYGAFHAIGQPSQALKISWPAAASLPPDFKRYFEAYLDNQAQLVLLSGSMPITGESFGREGYTEAKQGFQQQLDSWVSEMAPLTAQQRQRRAYQSIMADIWIHLKEALDQHAIPEADFAALGEDKGRQFIDSLPSRRIERHLLLQWAKNAQLLARSSDLNDWASLGPALAYCDVVVTEKHFANIVGREGFTTRATVLTNLCDLPSTIANLSQPPSPCREQ